jgi:hypothetical protein
MAQKNSFISLLEQIAQLNKNSVEIITKLNDVVSSDKNNVTIDYQDVDGRTSSYELPTVGWLKNEIDIANSNIKKIVSLEGDNSVIIIDENTSKKIKSIDLEREPDQISNINLVTNFHQNNNWFFENLINPTLSIEIDLDGKISNNVTKILSRRYIIKFEKDDAGELTTNGLSSLTSFNSTFLNNNDFTIETFLVWLNLSTNLGVLNKEDINQYRDDQYFDLNYKEINYKGYYSVLGIQRDTINNKVWYKLNTLDYYDRSGGVNTLSIGDVLSITSKKSYTKYKITEVNTSESLFRVSLERIEGYDPIPVGTNTLEYSSDLQSQTMVNISIGFDEYNVVFIKSINTENNIISSTWSKGMAFYSNNLVLNTDNNVSMSDYYLNSVYDYGMLLKDLVGKKIPSTFGVIPNAPELIVDNFKVTQINKHLTDTKDYVSLKKLHSQKNAIKSKLSETNESIIQKNKELNTKIFKSVAEKSKAQNEMNKLVKKQETDTKLFSSYVSQITNSVAEPTAEPKFRVRGFWDIPYPIVQEGYKTQEVIGFEIQWRYGSKLGAENTTDGFSISKKIIDNDSTIKQYSKSIAYYSQWIPYKTPIRTRTYNSTTEDWEWDIEDVSNADVPNINQLDIAINRSEKVEIRMKSISEVGYPETLLMSEWCDIITIEFPDELNNVIGENEFILKEATQEEMRVAFENELTSKGIIKHVEESFYVNEQYYGHTDKNLATSFKDEFGNTLSLFDYLKLMNDKITALEETIKRAKGELQVILYKGTEETIISNGSVINILINCEDYMIKSSNFSSALDKKFNNSIYMINDYYIELKNIAIENDLGLFSYFTLNELKLDDDSITNSYERPTFIGDDGKLYEQKNNQFVWILNDANIDGVTEKLYDGNTNDNNDNTLALVSDYRNLGNISSNGAYNLLTQDIWNNSTVVSDFKFGSTIHPKISQINSTTRRSTTTTSATEQTNENELVDSNVNGIHIMESQNTQKIPIEIYFKPDIKNPSIEDGNVVQVTYSLSESPKILKKALKFRIDEESSSRSFEFLVIFKLISHRQYALENSFDIQNAGNYQSLDSGD